MMTAKQQTIAYPSGGEKNEHGTIEQHSPIIPLTVASGSKKKTNNTWEKERS
jgi:hypothetical protein